MNKSRQINFSRVIIARKLSLLEYDMKKYCLSEKGMVNRYKKMGIDAKKIVDSHLRQQKSVEKVASYFIHPCIVVGESLTRPMVKDTDLIISVGGDNYFQYVSHYISHQYIVGINSDPVTSEGVILNYTADSFKKLVPQLKNSQFEVEKWTRIQAIINGKVLKKSAVSEIYLGSRERLYISRYFLEHQGVQEEHKDSGILIATGCGSTGWYRGMTTCRHKKAVTFPKTAREARFTCSETYIGKHNKYSMLNGIIHPGEQLKIVWLGHEKGVLSIDAQLKYRLAYQLDRGDRAEIKIAEHPLLVIK